MRVTISPEAERDLDDIAAFIAQDSRVHALALIERLTALCGSLAEAPLRYPVIRRRGDVEVRRAPHRTYSVYYTVNEDEVYVLHVLHSARDLERFFPDEP